MDAIPPSADYEEALGPIDRTFRYISQIPEAVKKDPLKTLGPVGAVALLGVFTLGPTVWLECGGDFYGLGLVPGRWLAMTASGHVHAWSGSVLDLPRVVISWPLSLPGKGLNWLTGGHLGRLADLPTLKEITNDTLLGNLYEGRGVIPQMESLLTNPDLSLIAPRVAGLKDLNMEKCLQILPRDERNAFLLEWLSISDAQTSEFGLEGAILLRLDAAHLGSVRALVTTENLQKYAPDLAKIGEKQMQKLLAERPELRIQLAMRFLSLQERSVLTFELRHGLRLMGPEAIEQRVIGLLCRDLKYPPKLHELLANEELATIAPRIAGLNPDSWSWQEVRALLAPDERMADIPTWETFYGDPLGIISSIFLPWQFIEQVSHGEFVPASAADSATMQTALMMGPPLLNVAKTQLPKMWQGLIEATDSPEQIRHRQMEQLMRQMQQMRGRSTAQ